MSTLRTFNLQHPESNNNNIQLAEGGGVSVTAGILTATNVSSTNVTTTEVTATNGTFSGNLSVGGVLSYEDVTNIDAVGLSTFRNGIHVTSGKVSVGSNNPSGNLNISYLQVGKGQVSSDHSLYNYNTSFTNNAYQNGNGTFAHITSRAVGVINLQDNVLTFSNGPGGTAGQSATLTERFRISSTGQVHLNGANTSTTGTSATDLLMANGAAIRFRKGDNSAWINSVGLDSNNNLKLGWGGSTSEIHFGISGIGDRMFLDSGGRLLLGTTDAGGNNTANHLVVSNNAGANDQAGITIRGGTSGRSQIFFSDGNSGQDEYRGMLRYDHQDNSMQFRTNATEKVRIDTAGKLIVDAGGEAQDIQIISHSGNSGHGIVYLRGNASNESSTIQLNHYGHADYHVSSGRAGNGLFSITRTNGGSDGIIMDSSGNMGLGVTPIAPGSLALHLGETTASQPVRLHMTTATTGANASDGFTLSIDGSSSNVNVIQRENADIQFYTSNTERLRIDSDGHLIQGNYTRLFNQNNNNRALIATGESSPSVYVSDSGNDSTGDGSSSSPFRTITKAWNYIPKVFTHNQTARIMIKGTSYTIDADYYMRGGASGGNWQWGPAVEIRSESGSQIDVYLRRGWRFENVDGLRFNYLNFICDNANGYLYFNSCARGKIYNTCDMTVSVTKGWSERVTYDNCRQFVDDMDIDVTSAASSGLGGLVVVRSKSSLSGTRYITKAGTVFGNSAVSVCDDSLVSCNWDVTNFATGYAFGYNHYNAETNGIGMLNGVTISNCTTGIRLRNNSFVRKYNLTYSGNSTNEDIQSGSLVN